MKKCNLSSGVIAPYRSLGSEVFAASGEGVLGLGEEGEGDEAVEDNGEDQRRDVEQDDVGEEEDQVGGGVALQPEAAGGHVAPPGHADRLRLR